MAKGILIKASGEVSLIEINGYKDLKRAVGGYIENVYFGEDASVYCNENGKELNLPYNKKATDLANERDIGWMPGDYFAGNVVIVGPGDKEGNDTDAPAKLIKELGLK